MAGLAGSVMVSPTLVSATSFDGGDEEADFAGGELLDFDGFGCEDAHGFDVEGASVGHEPDAAGRCVGRR